MIEVKNITKKYGSFIAVDDVSFEVKDNEIVGFLGPNGAGKSTTMNMITGYIEPTKGKIIVNGYDVSKSPIKAKKQIGYMPESVPLYNELTVKEFISYMADLRRVKKNKKEQIQKIMEQTGLIKVQNKLIKNISRGYKQRVSLAGTLIGNPEVLILDEPTVGLDPKQITEIRALIKELGKNHTVILSSHLLSEVSQICEKVIIINNGKIVAIDTPENLENKTNDDNSILVTVEDKDNKMKSINKKLKNAKSIKFVKDNKDGTKQYMITAEKDTDIRKEIFEVFPKENITIFELKKTENTLEDAFLQIINEKDNEAKKIEDDKAKKIAKRKEELAQMDKKDRKEAIKEDKKKLKQEKQEAFDKEWEQDKELAKAEKEERKKIKETKKQVKKQGSTSKNNEEHNKTKSDKANEKENIKKENEVKEVKEVKTENKEKKESENNKKDSKTEEKSNNIAEKNKKTNNDTNNNQKKSTQNNSKNNQQHNNNKPKKNIQNQKNNKNNNQNNSKKGGKK